MGSNPIFAIARPETVEARAGIGFDAGWDREDMSQQQCAGRQQSIGCAVWHCAAAGSHHSPSVGRLLVSEITNSVVNSLKAVRINTQSLGRQLWLVKGWGWAAETVGAKRLLRRGQELPI